MKSNKSTDRVSIKSLRSRLAYNKTTGKFKWKPCEEMSANWNSKWSFKETGYKDKVAGYIHIQLDKKLYLAHILAWAIVTGEWPKSKIDHKDTDPSNNKWKNLREASDSQNQHNRSKNKNNTTGHKGVTFDKPSGKYRAYITKSGKYKSLGFHDTLASAVKARKAGAKAYHGEFARH